MSGYKSQLAKPLPWIKLNFREMIGQYNQLSFEELGIFIHVAAAMWAEPEVKIQMPELRKKMRLKEGSQECEIIDNLIGYALDVSEDGFLSINWLSKAYLDVRDRSETAQINANKRWSKDIPNDFGGSPITRIGAEVFVEESEAHLGDF